MMYKNIYLVQHWRLMLQIQEIIWSGTGNLVLASCMVLEKQ